MDLSTLPLFGAIARKMAWLTQRQRVLAENIANVNTPHYKAADLKPLDFQKALSQTNGRLELVATDPRHLAGKPSAPFQADDALLKTPIDRTIAGNTVSMEDEMIKVSETGADYQLMTNLYKKQLGMLKEAIGHGSGS